MKPYEPIIVSGLAHGIDTIAHREALNHKLPTVAVLGHGFKTLYPSINRNLQNELWKKAVVCLPSILVMFREMQKTFHLEIEL